MACLGFFIRCLNMVRLVKNITGQGKIPNSSAIFRHKILSQLTLILNFFLENLYSLKGFQKVRQCSVNFAPTKTIQKNRGAKKIFCAKSLEKKLAENISYFKQTSFCWILLMFYISQCSIITYIRTTSISRQFFWMKLHFLWQVIAIKAM